MSNICNVRPILVSIRNAQAMLDVSRDTIWRLMREGVLGEVVGGPTKKYLYYDNLEKYAAGLPRERHNDSLASIRKQRGCVA